jgi:hypothetical protein
MAAPSSFFLTSTFICELLLLLSAYWYLSIIEDSFRVPTTIITHVMRVLTGLVIRKHCMSAILLSVAACVHYSII